MATNSAEGIKWNLSDLYASYDDPQIEATLKDCRIRAETFAARFRAVMEYPETLTAEILIDALNESMKIYEALGRVGSYAGLLYAADTTNPDYQNLEQIVEQRSTEIRNLLLFFEIQWLKTDDATVGRLIDAPSLETYRHYLQSLRRYRPHILSEAEEKIVSEKDNTGSNAFGRLFSEITSSLSFTLEKDWQTGRVESQPNSFLAPRARPFTAATGNGNALPGLIAARPSSGVYLRYLDPGSSNHGSPARLSESACAAPSVE